MHQTRQQSTGAGVESCFPSSTLLFSAWLGTNHVSCECLLLLPQLSTQTMQFWSTDCLLLWMNRVTTIPEVHPQVTIKLCCNTASNEWTTRGSCHLACHLKHWSCDLPSIQQSTPVPALGTRTPWLLVSVFIGASNSRCQLRARARSSIWKQDSTQMEVLHVINTDTARIWMASTRLTHRNKQVQVQTHVQLQVQKSSKHHTRIRHPFYPLPLTIFLNLLKS